MYQSSHDLGPLFRRSTNSNPKPNPTDPKPNSNPNVRNSGPVPTITTQSSKAIWLITK